ncbi:hypothetical protein QA599_18920 [Haloarculaceae archaeon H-GB1-1]|nr:hypothetical protein [Haloarculaceae archaeon H-GB1-1]
MPRTTTGTTIGNVDVAVQGQEHPVERGDAAGLTVPADRPVVFD